MTRRKPWSHFPDRLYDDERYLSLDDSAALGLHRMHVTCDRWGRGIAGDHALAGAIRVSPDKSGHIRTSLDSSGLVRIFTSTEGLLCYEIIDYDRDAPAGTKKNRKASDHEETGDESGRVQTSPDRACAEIEIEIERKTETDVHTRAREAPTPEAPQVDPHLCPAAVAWLCRRVEITSRHSGVMGDPDTLMAQADDLHGHTLRRLQRSPHFAACVQKALDLPDPKWGKSLRGGIGYLESIVHNHIPEETGSPQQSHMGKMAPSCQEYYEKTGIDPRKAPLMDDGLEDVLGGASA